MVISADRPQHAVPGDLSSALSHNRLLLAIPALCALAYPSLSSLLSAGLVAAHGSPAPNGAIVWVGVVASLALALAVMGVSFVFGLVLGSRDGASGEDLRARSIAHLAFATPSLYVGFANVAGVFCRHRHELELANQQRHPMLVSLSSLRLIVHYWVGPIAIITHLACGLRMVLLQREVSPVLAARLVPVS
jgi:hypothetical protein